MARFGLDPSLALLLGVLLVLSGLTFARGGGAQLNEGLSHGLQLLVRYGLIIVVSFLVAGLVENLIPHDWVEASLGDDSGVRGLVLASLAGALTPSGPFVSMPIAATLVRSGAGVGAVIAFVSAWALLAVHRLVAWELPILGPRIALLRYAVCLVLPVLAGLAARLVSRGWAP